MQTDTQPKQDTRKGKGSTPFYWISGDRNATNEWAKSGFPYTVRRTVFGQWEDLAHFKYHKDAQAFVRAKREQDG